MVETVGKKKNMAKRSGHQNSKNRNFRDLFLNIEKEFHHTVLLLKFSMGESL